METVNKLLTPLTPREEKIYQMRKEGVTYRKIGEAFGLSGTRIHQIQHRVERKIRRQKIEKLKGK